jgi:hypothetical protein
MLSQDFVQVAKFRAATRGQERVRCGDRREGLIHDPRIRLDLCPPQIFLQRRRFMHRGGLSQRDK